MSSNQQSLSDRSMKRKDDLLLWLILLVAAVLRFYRLGEISLSNDELSAIVRARFDSLSDMYRSGAFLDGHPAGVQVFLYYWIRWFGDSAFSIRLPFVLFSLGSILLVCRLGSLWFHRAAGLLAAACIATFEYPLLYSILARSYSPGLFFSLWSVYAWSILVSGYRAGQRPGWKAQSNFALALMLAVHTHYFVVLLLAMIGLSGLFLVPRQRWISYVSLCAPAVLSFLPELPFFFGLLQVGGLGNWLGEPPSDFLWQYLKLVFNGSAIAAAAVIVSIMLFRIRAVRPMKWNAWHTVSTSWFILSYLVAYGYSLLIQPILQPSTLLFTFPLLLIAVFSFWPDRSDSLSWRFIPVIVLLFLGSFGTVVLRDFHHRPPFGVFKEVAEDLSGWKQESGRLPAVVNVVNPEYIRYYFNRLPDAPSEVYFKVESPTDLALLREAVDTCTAEYFAYGWSNNFHPYEIERIIRKRFPFLVEARHYFNAESWLFSRVKGKPRTPSLRHYSQDYNDTTLTGFSIRFDTSATSAPGVMDFRKGVDYAPDLHDRIAVPVSGLTILHASVWYKAADTTGNQALVLSFDDHGENVWWESIRLNDYNRRPGTWQQAFLSKPVPSGHDSLDIKVYLWNPDGKSFLADDLQAELETAVDPYFRK